MKLKTSKRTSNQPPFDYEGRFINKNKVPLFISIILDNHHTKLDDREYFYNNFAHEYLNNEEFRRNVENLNLVFEGPKYVGFTNSDSINKLGTPRKVKTTVNVEDLSETDFRGIK